MQLDCLRNADCIAGMNALPEGSVDLAFADPPFNIGYDYDVYDDRRADEQYLAWSRTWIEAVKRVLKPNGTFWLAIGDEYAAELKMLAQRELGFTCRSWVIWYYTFGVNCKTKFSRSHAHLFHFVKDAKNFTFNAAAVRVPSARQLVYADARGNPEGRLPDDTWVIPARSGVEDTWILRPQDLPEGFAANEDSWYFPRVCGTFKERAGFHGCQMPEQLLGRIIKVSSNPDETVLDPFAGSGSTLVVAKKLGRRFLGFELSKTYAAKVQARLDAAVNGQPLDGAPEPTVSAPRTPRKAKPEPIPPAAAVDPQPTRPVPTSEEVERAIVSAFSETRNGFSVDRVIADPELNGEFLDRCQRLGMPGTPADWNHRLMNLRKQGLLKGLGSSRERPLAADRMDRYSFACEIAIQCFHTMGRSLDETLCNPILASEFDRLVRSLFPEELTSFEVRWAAFRIRKRAHDIRNGGLKLKARDAAVEKLPSRTDIVGDLDWDRIPDSPGLYWLRSAQDETKRLYVGETLNLRERLELQFRPSGFGFWDTDRTDLQIRYRTLDKALLEASQSRWIGEWRPRGNWTKLGIAI